MPDRMVELPSREKVSDRLIRGCLDLPADRRRRDLPVILLLGTCGSGKRVLLEQLNRRCAGVRPCVLRDLETQKLRPHEVAARLAFGLSRRVRQFGRLKFPRLQLGLVAIRSAISLDDYEQALGKLSTLLKSHHHSVIHPTLRAPVT
jgi:hypothetical protein